MGTKLIEEGANGTHLGWNWNVIGADEIDGEELWKVSVENEQVRTTASVTQESQCGFEDSPWAVRQNVMFTFQVTKGTNLLVVHI